MRGAIPPLQYFFMAWCLLNNRNNLYTFTLPLSWQWTFELENVISFGLAGRPTFHHQWGFLYSKGLIVPAHFLKALNHINLVFDKQTNKHKQTNKQTAQHFTIKTPTGTTKQTECQRLFVTRAESCSNPTHSSSLALPVASQ